MAVSSGGQHVCTLLVTSLLGRSHTQRAARCQASAAASTDCAHQGWKPAFSQNLVKDRIGGQRDCSPLGE